MIKAKMNDGSILLGLSRRNIELLMDGKPIKFNLRDMDLPDRNVIIHFGETEDAMYEELVDFINLERTRVRFSTAKPGTHE